MYQGQSSRKIVITTDGRTTLARLYDGKTVISRAEARCHPQDAFDFSIGAKLAFGRLMGADCYKKHFPEPVAEDKPKFKVGDKVKVIGNSGIIHYFAIGTIGEINEIDEQRQMARVNFIGYHQWINFRDLEPYEVKNNGAHI